MAQNFDFNRNKNQIISIVIIIITCIVAYKIYQNNSAALDNLKKTRDAEVKKNELLTKLGALDKKVKGYKAFLNKDNKVNKTAISNNIGSIAKDSLVKISSIKPSPEQVSAVYIQYNFDLKASASSYEELANFISRLEESDDVFMVEILIIKPNTGKGPDNVERAKGVTAELRVSTYVYKE